MGTTSLALRIVIVILTCVTMFIPWIWNECILAMTSFSGMGLCMVGLAIAIGLLVVDTGDELHCEVIEGIMACIFIIAGLLQIQYKNSDCNVILFLLCLLAVGILFFVDMILLVTGNSS